MHTKTLLENLKGRKSIGDIGIIQESTTEMDLKETGRENVK